jgi:hypothetical protein
MGPPMKHAIAIALIAALALPANAADLAPPPPPDDIPPPVGETQMGYYDRCFGVPRTGGGVNVGIYGEVPITPAPNAPAPIPSLGGGKDDKAWLVVLVVAVAVLPVVVYSVDEPAPRILRQRFECPTFGLELSAGADNSHDALGPGSFGVVSTRFTFGVSHVATDFQYDAAPDSVSGFATHLLLRATPKAHVEGGLALGYKRSYLGNAIEDGFEFGLPHRYALWRDGLRTLSLDVRPMLLIGNRVEPSLEAAFLFPLAQVVQLRVGGRMFTFEGNFFWGLSGGLSFTL